MTFLVKFFPFILAWVFVKSSIRKDKIFFLQKSSEKTKGVLLVMTWTENEEDITASCESFTDEGLINTTLASSDFQVRTLTEYEMQILLGDCLEFDHQRQKRDTDSAESEGSSMVDDEDEYDHLSRTNRRRRPRYRTTSNKRMARRGPKTNKTTVATSPSTTISLNEIDDSYGEEDKARNRTSVKGERESESEESTDAIETTESANTSELFTTTESANTTEPSTTPGYDGLPIIFLGTKWCGAGDIAEDYDDLGRYEDTDRCCRAHDHCNDTLAPGETKHNLTNTSPFTKLSCRCDEEFRNCLNNVSGLTANTIGDMYFNLLRRECYALDYPPSTTCTKYLTLFKITCLEYEKDTSKEKIYQWITPKRYRRS